MYCVGVSSNARFGILAQSIEVVPAQSVALGAVANIIATASPRAITANGIGAGASVALQASVVVGMDESFVAAESLSPMTLLAPYLVRWVPCFLLVSGIALAYHSRTRLSSFAVGF